MDFDRLFIGTELPKPLAKEQIYSYLEKYKQGDLEARKNIIIHNIRLVVSQVYRKFANAPYDKKELISIGLIGLIKSVDTFDIEKKAEFSTYALRCIDNEILMFMRKGKKYINDESLYALIKIDIEGKNQKLEDILEDFTSNFVLDYENLETYREIRKVIQTLPDRDRKIIMLYFGFIDDKTYTQEEISKKFNITRSYVSKIIIKNLKIISTQLQEIGIIEATHSTLEKNKEKRSENSASRKITKYI